MKSPLVEALRQAGGDEPKSDSTETVTAGQEVVDVGHESEAGSIPEHEELQLMESTGVLQIDAVNDPVGGDTQESPRDMESATEAVSPSHVEVSAHSGWHWYSSRIGLVLPLICLVLALTSSAFHFGYHKLGGNYENTDLASMSSQTRQSVSVDAGDAIEDNAVKNRFQLVFGPQRASRYESNARPAMEREVVAEKPVTVPPDRHDPVVAELRSATDKSFDDKAFGVLTAAYQAYTRGDYAAAEAGYRRALELAPRHPNGLQGLAAVLHRSGKRDESLHYFEMLLAVNPDNTTAAAALLAGRRDSPTLVSESEIKHLIQRHPDSAQLHFSLGTLLARQSRWPDARLAFANALQLDESNADFLFNLAVSLEHLGQHPAARNHYEAALEAVTAMSSIDSDVVVARIEKLAPLSDNGDLLQ